MMSTTAEVKLWGSTIGTVALADGDDFARFEFDTSFRTSGIEIAPLTMPLSSRVYSFPQLSRTSFHGLPGLLADSLPDRFGNAVIDSWLSAQGRLPGSMNPVERLCYTGTRGMGALEFVPSLGPTNTSPDTLEVEALVDLASQILSKRAALHVEQGGHAMEQIITVGTSAGGARAKAVIAWNEDTGELRSGQIDQGDGFNHWLMKFDDVAGNRDKEDEDGPQYTVIEYAYHLMAKAAGIDMAECRLFDEGTRRHFMTRRFDRTRTGAKVHMQSLGALAHLDFNVPAAHGYEQTVEVCRRLGLGQVEAEQIFRRMVFNVLAYNHDDYVKNTSFLMDKRGSWSLAPAYDITFAYNPHGAWTAGHQMTINGKRSGIDRADCMTAAAHMSIKAPRARAIIGDVIDAVRGWSGFADEAGLSEDIMRDIADQIMRGW